MYEWSNNCINEWMNEFIEQIVVWMYEWIKNIYINECMNELRIYT